MNTETSNGVQGQYSYIPSYTTKKNNAFTINVNFFFSSFSLIIYLYVIYSEWNMNKKAVGATSMNLLITTSVRIVKNRSLISEAKGLQPHTQSSKSATPTTTTTTTTTKKKSSSIDSSHRALRRAGSSIQLTTTIKEPFQTSHNDNKIENEKYIYTDTIHNTSTVSKSKATLFRKM